ncbi:hypothetical protein TNCV_1366321 [Trichonephila clavipes]|nr:hypothetical protein TNCV_1366321 [Trichonephila clavipes]
MVMVMSSGSNEAHFWLNGYVNKQNCRIWSEANPQVYVETPLHPEKLTVWFALWAGGIIGPYFKNDVGHNQCQSMVIMKDCIIVQFRNEKVSNHGSIPIIIDCNMNSQW